MNFAYEQLKKTHDVAFRVLETLTAKSRSFPISLVVSGRPGRSGSSKRRYGSDYDGVHVIVPLAYFAGLMIDPAVKGVSQLKPGT